MKRLNNVLPASALLLLLVLLVLSQTYTRTYLLKKSDAAFTSAPISISLSGQGVEAAVIAAQTAKGSAEVFAAAEKETYARLEDNAHFGLEADGIVASYLLLWYETAITRALVPLTPTFTEAVRARELALPYAHSLLAAAGSTSGGEEESAPQMAESGQKQAMRLFDFMLGQLSAAFDVVLERVSIALPDYLYEAQVLLEEGQAQFNALFGGKVKLPSVGTQAGAFIVAFLDDETFGGFDWNTGGSAFELKSQPDTWMAPSAGFDPQSFSVPQLPDWTTSQTDHVEIPPLPDAYPDWQKEIEQRSKIEIPSLPDASPQWKQEIDVARDDQQSLWGKTTDALRSWFGFTSNKASNTGLELLMVIDGPESTNIEDRRFETPEEAENKRDERQETRLPAPSDCTGSPAGCPEDTKVTEADKPAPSLCPSGTKSVGGNCYQVVTLEDVPRGQRPPMFVDETSVKNMESLGYNCEPGLPGQYHCVEKIPKEWLGSVPALQGNSSGWAPFNPSSWTLDNAFGGVKDLLNGNTQPTTNFSVSGNTSGFESTDTGSWGSDVWSSSISALKSVSDPILNTYSSALSAGGSFLGNTVGSVFGGSWGGFTPGTTDAWSSPQQSGDGFIPAKYDVTDPKSCKTLQDALTLSKKAAKEEAKEVDYLWIRRGTKEECKRGDNPSTERNLTPDVAVIKSELATADEVAHIHTHPAANGQRVPPSLLDAAFANGMLKESGAEKLQFYAVDSGGNVWKYSTDSTFSSFLARIDTLLADPKTRAHLRAKGMDASINRSEAVQAAIVAAYAGELGAKLKADAGVIGSGLIKATSYESKLVAGTRLTDAEVEAALSSYRELGIYVTEN